MFSDEDDNEETLHEKLNGGLFGDEDSSILSEKTDTKEYSKIKWYKKKWTINFCLFISGIVLAVGIQILFYITGLIKLPADDSGSLNTPECYACVNLLPLDGEYQSVIDIAVTGIEFKVKTIQIYHGNTSTVDTIVDVIKDPVGIFTACECDNVGFKLSPINCSLTYVYDKCVDDCNSENGITDVWTLYDPKSDQIESSIIVSVLGQDVQQVAIFTKVDDDKDD